VKRGVLAGATLASALAAIAASMGLAPFIVLAVCKPLTTLLVLVHALSRGGASAATRRVALGLVLSLAGDVALLWPERGFVPGLVAFLLAHAAYLVAFTREARLAARPAPFIVYALAAGGILSWLWPGVPAALRLPVSAYVLFLSAMAAQAAVVAVMSRGAVVLAAGGALFMVSDALLATNKFGGGVPLAPVFILGTYWAAQWCIATWALGIGDRVSLTPSPARGRGLG